MFKSSIVVASALLFLFSVQSASALSPDKLKQLNSLLQERALEVLGPPQPDYTGYKGNFHTRQPVPPGCTAQEKHDPSTRKTFVRVMCK